MILRYALGLCLVVGGASAAHGQEPPNCGLQRAAVVKVKDPEGRDRLLISAPALSLPAVWAERVYPKKPLRGPPAAIGDQVYVLFEGCDPARPVVVGFARP